jgi:thiol-disulfide isomerase/thioredoxin
MQLPSIDLPLLFLNSTEKRFTTEFTERTESFFLSFLRALWVKKKCANSVLYDDSECGRAAPQSAIGCAYRSGIARAALIIVTLLVAGCGGNGIRAVGPDGATGAASDNSVALGDLPEGLGRGFPQIRLDGVDNTDTGLTAGALAPDFQMVLEDGQHLSLRSLQGQPVLINFWATWCGPCRLEMPEIVEQYRANDDLVVLAVNEMEERTAIEDFVAEFQMSMPVVLDADGELRRLYEVRGMPTSIFIDRTGRITAVWPGILTADKLQEFLKPIL